MRRPLACALLQATGGIKPINPEVRLAGPALTVDCMQWDERRP
jgi:regulator of RNase E activity RraA